jgi:glycolate oxidase
MDRNRLIDDLRQVVGPRGVIDDPDALMTYDADGCVMDTHDPQVVVLPTTTDQVSAIVGLAAQYAVPIVPRGAGTGLSGGATPMQGGIIISTVRMSRILELDIANERVLVQPGVINWELTQQLTHYGYHFAPDPSSQKACTIGGNIANNSGGPHCLKYGVTTNHVLGVELVLGDGSVVWTGDGTPDSAGYDLTGVVNGSEGTFGVVTATWLRITRLPEAVRVVLALYPDISGATNTVSQVIARGLLPAALEIMDRLAIKAVNDMYKLGMPDEAGALLIVEVDGVEDGLDELLNDIVTICWDNGALDVRPARTPAEQVQVWSARKNAFGAMGRLAPTYHLVDTVVPRSRLPATMAEVERIAQEFDLPVANVFHAGDGNLHPIILFDRRDQDQNERALQAATRCMHVSLEQGGSISGEHGIGVEKQEYMPLMFSKEDLEVMAALHQSFDPEGRFNPGKIFPRAYTTQGLAEQRRNEAFAGSAAD